MSKAAAVRGMTLIELMVSIGVVAILVALVTPSMRELIVLQRMKSINAELVTDLQYARSESVSRNLDIRIKFMVDPLGAMTCYVLYIPAATGGCDCIANAPGSVCSPAQEEIRTTRIASSTDVKITSTPANLIFKSNGMLNAAGDTVMRVERIGSGTGKLQTTISQLGRASVCAPNASVSGVAPC